MTDFNLFLGLFEHPLLLEALLLLNLPLYRKLFGIVFSGIGALGPSVSLHPTPNLQTSLKIQYLEDQWAEFKLYAWFMLCALCVAAEYNIAVQTLDWWNENVLCCGPTPA